MAATEKQKSDSVTWGGIITFNFAPEFGTCLDELEDEYDDLITDLETQQVCTSCVEFRRSNSYVIVYDITSN